MKKQNIQEKAPHPSCREEEYDNKCQETHPSCWEENYDCSCWKDSEKQLNIKDL